MRMPRGNDRQRDRLDSGPVWFGLNALRYLAVLVVLFAPYAGYLLGPRWSVRAILVELVLALPGLLILLVLPSIVILAVLWNVRPVSTLRFRSVALVLLVLPAFLSRDLAQFGYAAAVGVVFALVMIRSRAADR